jgi:hypothetical protein
MGLIISVYRNAEITSDCTNGGISGRFQSLTVVNVEGPFNPTPERPAVLLEEHHKGCLRIVPAVETPNGYTVAPGWFMNGGNYAATSDSRFTGACEKLLGHRFYGAVAVHDRQE